MQSIQAKTTRLLSAASAALTALTIIGLPIILALEAAAKRRSNRPLDAK